MIKHFLVIAWRNIKRRKTLSFIQIMCLSVGLAAFILVARYVQYEKDYDKFNENFDRIYRIHSHSIGDKMDERTYMVAPLAKYLRDNIAEVEDAIMINEIWGEYLSADAEHIFNEPDGYLAPSRVFEMFSFELIRGDKHTVLDDANAIVLSETLAKKYFPGEDAMGKILFDDRKNELRITGIMKDIPEQSSITATYFRSNAGLLKKLDKNWHNSSFRCMVLLKPNVSVETVNSKISNIINEFDKDASRLLYLRPLSKLHLKDGPRDDSGSVIFFFSFIGILTLILACVSFMNLTTSFSTLRSVEIGVRKVSGSNRNYIRLQFLAEAFVLAFISLVGAIALAYLLLPLFNVVVNRNIQLDLQQNPLFIAFLLAAVLITGFLGGSYPALVISSFKPVMVLKGKTPFKRGKVTGLQAMVYVQFILSIVLITSSLWMYRQVNYVKTKDLGFIKENLLHCRLPTPEGGNISYNQFRQRILSYPGIEDMSVSLNSPLYDSWGTRIRYEGGPVEDDTYVRWNQACQNYLNTMSLTLVEGRNFSTEYPADRQSCLINETAVKHFHWTDPIGKWVDIEGKHLVIGVLKDFNIEDVHKPILPYVLLLRDEQSGAFNDLTFKVNPVTVEESLTYINKVIKEMFPNILFEVNDYDVGTYRMVLKIWINVKNTFAFFTVLAVIIAAMGLFGLVVFASQQRVKEIGIRKVQGAYSRQIIPMVTRQFLLMVSGANIIVYPIARILENVTPGHFKYSFKIYDVLFVAIISILITLLSSALQAYKASRLNPVEALRYE